MEELAIKIRIYDRQYPMKVQPKDESYVRKAAVIINSQIKAYSNKFDTIDIQDLLAMIAFDCLVDSLKMKNILMEDQEIMNNSLKSMIRLIDDTM